MSLFLQMCPFRHTGYNRHCKVNIYSDSSLSHNSLFRRQLHGEWVWQCLYDISSLVTIVWRLLVTSVCCAHGFESLGWLVWRKETDRRQEAFWPSDDRTILTDRCPKHAAYIVSKLGGYFPLMACKFVVFLLVLPCRVCFTFSVDFR